MSNSFIFFMLYLQKSIIKKEKYTDYFRIGISVYKNSPWVISRKIYILLYRNIA